MQSDFSLRSYLPSYGGIGGLKWTRVTLQRTAVLYAGVSRSTYSIDPTPSCNGIGGLKWTRTTDLALIRRAL